MLSNCTTVNAKLFSGKPTCFCKICGENLAFQVLLDIIVFNKLIPCPDFEFGELFSFPGWLPAFPQQEPLKTVWPKCKKIRGIVPDRWKIIFTKNLYRNKSAVFRKI